MYSPKEITFRDLYELIQLLEDASKISTHWYPGHSLGISVYSCHKRVNFNDENTDLGIINVFFFPEKKEVMIRKVVDGYSDYDTETTFSMNDRMIDHISDLNKCSQGAKGLEIIKVTSVALRKL